MARKVSRNSLRNLPQYKVMSEEEFDSALETLSSLDDDPDFEQKVQSVISELGRDYVIEDLNINDKLSLEELARSYTYVASLSMIERECLRNGDLQKMRIVSSIKKEYIDAISRIQNDLNITRKSRQTDEGESLGAYLPSIQKKAKNFLSQRLAYIYCPECKMLVSTTWYSDWQGDNVMSLTCPRDGCGHKFTTSSSHLARNKNKNIDGVLGV